MISCLKLRTHGVNQAQIIKEKCSEFFCKFKENYISKFITPYIHILGHIEKINLVLEEADLILNKFSMKGVEKLNDMLENYYHRSSNKKKISFHKF